MPRASRPYGRTTTLEPIVAKSTSRCRPPASSRMPPVFFSGSGLGSDAVHRGAEADRDAVDAGEPHHVLDRDPVRAGDLPEREVTAYEPGGGLTVLGMTAKVRCALSFAPTSQTRRSPSEYTTRWRRARVGGHARAGFSGFCSGTSAEAGA